MDDEELVRMFQAGEMPAGGFAHPEHVRVAWWYLRRYPLPEALSRFSAALRALAVARTSPLRELDRTNVQTIDGGA